MNILKQLPVNYLLQIFSFTTLAILYFTFYIIYQLIKRWIIYGLSSLVVCFVDYFKCIYVFYRARSQLASSLGTTTRWDRLTKFRFKACLHTRCPTIHTVNFSYQRRWNERLWTRLMFVPVHLWTSHSFNLFNGLGPAACVQHILSHQLIH